MGQVLITESYLEDIADAIRAKNGGSDTYKPSEMAEAIIDIPGGGATIKNQNKSVSPSTSQQSVTYDSGYTGLGTVTVAAMPSGTVTAPATITGSSATPSHSSTTLTLSKTVSVTPSVTTAGYVSSGTAGNSSVSLSATDSNFTAGNIKKNVSIFGVTGSYEGGGGGTPNLQAKTYTVDSAGTETIEADSGYDGLSEVEVTVPSAYINCDYDAEYDTVNNARKWSISPNYFAEYGGWIDEGYFDSYTVDYNAVAKNTSVTPTESAQTIGGANYMMEGAVTVAAISSTYVGSGITRRTSSDLSASGATVTVPAGYYSSQATKSVTSGSATGPSSITQSSATVSTGTNTLTLTKTGVSTTPTVSAGYVASATSSTATVALTASVTTKAAATITPGTSDQTIASGTYLTGTQTISGDADLVAGNIKKNVSIFGVTGTYEGSGGGGTSMTVATATKTLSSAASSIQFTSLSGEPTSFVLTSSSDQSTGGTKVVSVVYDGTSCHGMDVTSQAEADTGFSQSYSSGTLTVTATTASFQANQYKLVYTYGGSAANIGTADVQVGSGATSITFTGLSNEPDYFSCIFKSNFSTSSGYQRVVEVVYDGTSTYGHAMDSSAKAQTSWSYSYNSGSLTITSTGTNNGGYFHQPGYYQLTYATGGDSTLQKKTATPTNSDQTITADTAQGYTALSQVKVEGVVCENLTAGNIKSGVTVKIGTDTDDDSVTSVTGTYGGGGDSKNVQINQSTTRTTTNTLSKANGDLTVSKTGTYDVYWTATRSATSTNYTWGSQLYVGGSAYGSENTTWSNHVQNNHLSNVSLTANQKIAVYTRGRSGSYYVYAPMLVIVEA